jgi:hypothetical protein
MIGFGEEGREIFPFRDAAPSRTVELDEDEDWRPGLGAAVS